MLCESTGDEQCFWKWERRRNRRPQILYYRRSLFKSRHPYRFRCFRSYVEVMVKECHIIISFSLIDIKDVLGDLITQYFPWILKKLADKISGLGYLVVIPDFFFGDCIHITSPPEVRANWLNNHPPEKGCENARKIIAELKSRGVYAVGAAGFCWGGMMVVKLAKYYDIKAAVILHPGRLKDIDVKEVKVPIAILGGELDQLCPQEEVRHYGEILSENQEVESFVKIFQGVGHGWAARYSEDDESAVRSAEEAHRDMLNWLTKYVT
ncbi:hypothetical protein SSX86_025946 [Deinandra increscens subsp. villosa]|uniref:Dienelactone hydrolase domain-containing protein n=1 Tax=Deinandra increscens subsp. villosa TaxID=3103831 RepID=A0AAP0GNI6_9ASTR